MFFECSLNSFLSYSRLILYSIFFSFFSDKITSFIQYIYTYRFIFYFRLFLAIIFVARNKHRTTISS